MKRTLYNLLGIFIFILCALPDSAQTVKIDSLTALLPDLKGEKLSSVYLELAKEYSYIDPSKIIYYANLALPIALENKDEKQECSIYLLLGAGSIFSGNFEAGREYTEKGMAIARKIDDQKSIVIAMNSMAAYKMNLGHYDEALELFKKSLAKAQELGLDDQVAKVQLNIGSVLTTRGDRISGLRYLMSSDPKSCCRNQSKYIRENPYFTKS